MASATSNPASEPRRARRAMTMPQPDGANGGASWAGPSILPAYPAPDPAKPRIAILYASSTGTAADVAHRITHDLVRSRFQARCSSVDSYNPAQLIEETHVLFIIATTGAGEFPTTALPFWRFLLRDGLPNDILSDVQTAVFGLGDSSYPRFCWPARKMTRRLRALGAQDLLELDTEGQDNATGKLVPEGDDQHPLGLEGTLMPWLEALYAKLEAQYPSSAQYPRIPDELTFPPRIRVRLRRSASDPKASDSSTPKTFSRSPYIPQGWQAARLTRNERVTAPEHFQDVRAIEWRRVDGAPIAYRPGDVASLLPENDPALIERLLKRMGWDQNADELVEVVTEGDEPLPPHLPPYPITLRHLLTSYLSPLSVPRRSFFALLRNFLPPTHLEHEKLTEFLTPGEGTDEMFEYAQRVRRTCLEVLEEFKGVRGVGIEWAVELFGWMQERKFSIASAPAVSPNKIELAVAIVKYRTRLREPRRGICTAWLSRLEPRPTGDDTAGEVAPSFAFKIEPGTLRLPASDEVPLILVGPGTGVAPMRSLAYERLSRRGVDVAKILANDGGSGHVQPTAAQAQGEDEANSPLPNIQLFLGCRHSQRDFLFGTEWAQLAAATASASTLPARLSYALAPSRDKESEGGPKVYVQDKIRELGRRVWEMLSQSGAYFYISGSSGKMPEAVRAAVKQAAVEHGQLDEAQAERFMDALEAKGRWQEECWS